ncbi:putative CBS domain and cyclic nucleotide-regulated nucleotidyltransferase [Ammonifex degensii KC4]|uniref:CBS domain and cyclic nucleotide-regulated nucleotidyltransferase n=1 Tax=Ammonifex degensii (strain DSM 10501 / KC4) TaxID=429009 RepID=C9R9F4_AMMDK|nr:DUF294 nucleotidyltransferase-like domain-containing protein [Ammonifex degensii]ACX52933.1 putative CBS domain and cyclic nucleotide-regulated nucleotidyltransferase [Ammonifex degensii KC4]
MGCAREELCRQLPPFSALSEKGWENCRKELRYEVYPPGSYIFRWGEPSRGFLFFVVTGLVELVVPTAEGKEQVVSLRSPAEFFGETVFFTDGTYPASSRAAEETTCCLLSRKLCERLMREEPAFALSLAALLADRIRQLWAEVIRERYASRVEERPLRRRLYEIMSTPVQTCTPECTLSTVADKLTRHGISSVVVVDPAGRPLGLVTEKELVKAMTTPGFSPDKVTVREVMRQDPLVLSPGTLTREALVGMVQRQAKHVVVAEKERVCGIVTLSDLLRSQNLDAVSAVAQVERASTPKALREVMPQIERVLVGLVNGRATAAEIGPLVAELYDRLTARLLSFAEAELQREGWGKPPAGYCWLTLGSGGRKEQLYPTDQDNALIYADPPSGEEERFQSYFLALGRKVTEYLAELGFSFCPGEVMASNPLWCRSLKEWRENLWDWLRHPTGDWVRKMTIFFDFRPVYGRFELAAALREAVFKGLEAQPGVLVLLAQDALSKRLPLGPFRQVVTEKVGPHKHELDLKRGVLVHFVDCVRLFALREKIEETSTFARLEALAERGVFSAEDTEEFQRAYDAVLTLRLKLYLERRVQGKAFSNYVNPRHLSSRDQSALRQALISAARLHFLTGKAFRVG